MKSTFKLLSAILFAAALAFTATPAYAVTNTVLGTPGAQYYLPDGTIYTADSNGVMYSVAAKDIVGLLKQGAVSADFSPPFSNGIAANPASYTVVGSITVAQLNAGKIIVPAVTGRTIFVTNATMTATGGNAATCTLIGIEDTAASPVIILEEPVAALVSGVAGGTWSASAVIGAGFGAAGLTASKGIQAFKTGSSCATMTALSYAITYSLQ